MKPETEGRIKEILRQELRDFSQIKKENGPCPGCQARDTKIKELTSELSKAKEVVKDPHEDIMKGMTTNYAKCKNCDMKIKNPRIVTKFKTCPNCNSNTVPKQNDFCPTCGKESDEWDESDVEIEEEE